MKETLKRKTVIFWIFYFVFCYPCILYIEIDKKFEKLSKVDYFDRHKKNQCLTWKIMNINIFNLFEINNFLRTSAFAKFLIIEGKTNPRQSQSFLPHSYIRGYWNKPWANQDPCSICLKTVTSRHRAVSCDSCNLCSHIKCTQYSMSLNEYIQRYG